MGDTERAVATPARSRLSSPRQDFRLLQIFKFSSKRHGRYGVCVQFMFLLFSLIDFAGAWMLEHDQSM